MAGAHLDALWRTQQATGDEVVAFDLADIRGDDGDLQCAVPQPWWLARARKR